MAKDGITRLSKAIAGLLLVAGLHGCIPSGEGGSRPLIPTGIPEWGGGGGSTAPPMPRSAPQSQPEPPKAFYHQNYNEPGREVHAASSYEDCQEMLRSFQRQGRRVKMQAQLNPRASSKDDPLRWLCIFTGEDTVDNQFDDRRYNSADEYSTDPPPTRTPYRGYNNGQRRFRESRRHDRPPNW